MRRVVFLALVTVLALCAGSVAGAATEVATPAVAPLAPEIWKPPIPRRIKWPSLPKRPPARPPVVIVPWTLIVDDLAAAFTHSQARDALARLYRRDGYKKVLVDGFCHGMSWLGEQPADARVSSANWRSYFLDFFDDWWRQHLRRYIQSRIERAVDDWLSVFEMARVSPSAAVFYARACLGP